MNIHPACWLFRGHRRVAFVIAGVQKGGTTALYQHLQQHPGVSMPRRKECHYFNTDHYFALRDRGVRAYHAMFPRLKRGQIRGEATPAYLYCPAAAARIARYNPDMRVIVLLRDPVARAYSHWVMEKSRGFESLDFAAALRAEPARLRMEPHHLVYSYVDRGRYARQLQHLWQWIPREQTLVLRSESLLHEAHDTMCRVCAFLGIAPLPRDLIINTPVFAQSYDRTIDPGLRKEILAGLAGDIQELALLLDWDCTDWLRC